MAITQGDYGGGGSTTNVCPIGPQDQVGSIDNILSRLTAIETILSQLLGTDITAIQLSDISQDMGTILGGTLGSGMLTQILYMIAKRNVWAYSGNDNFIASEGQEILVTGTNGGYVGTGMYLLTGTSTDEVIGRTSGSLYSYRKQTYDSGFHFESRVLFDNAGQTSNPGLNCRFFTGLQSAWILSSNPIYNVDDPDGFYIGFQYSTPRGDSTFKLITKDQPLIFGTVTVHIIDTGVPVSLYHWYDFKLDCVGGSESTTWEITDLTTNTTISGAVSNPIIYNTQANQSMSSAAMYNAGLELRNCSTDGHYQSMMVNYIWAQSLDMETNTTGHQLGI